VAYSDLRRYAFLNVEVGSQMRRVLSEISGGLLKAFLFVLKTIKSIPTGSKLTYRRKDTLFAENMLLSVLMKRFLKGLILQKVPLADHWY